jgi:hypothetical protein
MAFTDMVGSLACAGIGCPPAGVIADILAEVERTFLEQQKLTVGN